ncbi:MAG: hypothetical protein ACE366_22715 [Bradymonadia bacterium]
MIGEGVVKSIIVCALSVGCIACVEEHNDGAADDGGQAEVTADLGLQGHQEGGDQDEQPSMEGEVPDEGSPDDPSDRGTSDQDVPDDDLPDDGFPDEGLPDEGVALTPGSGQTCPECAPDEICIQFVDSVCSMASPRCVPNPLGCTQRTLTAECCEMFCGSGEESNHSCHGESCEGSAPGAFMCIGTH